jgi:hypothetical protein
MQDEGLFMVKLEPNEKIIPSVGSTKPQPRPASGAALTDIPFRGLVRNFPRNFFYRIFRSNQFLISTLSGVK